MASPVVNSLRSFTRQCPFMQRHNIAAPASSTALIALANKCPIGQRALAHTSATLHNATPTAPTKGAAEPMRAMNMDDAPRYLSTDEEDILKEKEHAHNSFRRLMEKFNDPSMLPKECPVAREKKIAAQAAEAHRARLYVRDQEPLFNYDEFFDSRISKKKDDKSYRIFNNINRLAGAFPHAHGRDPNKQLTVWCSNDYLGMSRNPAVLEAMRYALDKYGAGSGGTRNISGNGQYHELLEAELADLHAKEAALVFTSCYVANDTTLQTLAAHLPNCVILSDDQNHASMIAGIRNSRAEKIIFKHNDPVDLEERLRKLDPKRPKIVAFESVYSMSGAISPIEDICDVAHKYGALTFLDEVHAVGMYGARGAGVAEQFGRRVMDKVDIVTGTLGKAYGVIGGYTAGNAMLVDMVRSYGAGLIFTTSLPPAVMAGALASVKYLKESQVERDGQRRNVRSLKSRLSQLGIPMVPSPGHIIPIHVGDAGKCKQLSDELLVKHNIYVQSINYPTVPVGSERLRVTPTPVHNEPLQDHFLDALTDVWKRNGLDFLSAPQVASA